MATNQRYTHGDHIALPATAAVNSGDPVRIGSISGVAQTTAAIGEQVTIWRDGSYDLTVNGATTPGAPVYITSANKLVTTASGNQLFGYALAASAAGDSVVEVLVRGND